MRLRAKWLKAGRLKSGGSGRNVAGLLIWFSKVVVGLGQSVWRLARPVDLGLTPRNVGSVLVEVISKRTAHLPTFRSERGSGETTEALGREKVV